MGRWPMCSLRETRMVGQAVWLPAWHDKRAPKPTHPRKGLRDERCTHQRWQTENRQIVAFVSKKFRKALLRNFSLLNFIAHQTMRSNLLRAFSSHARLVYLFRVSELKKFPYESLGIPSRQQEGLQFLL